MATRQIFSYFARSPSLPIAPAEYQQRYQDQLNNSLRLYFDQVDNFVNGPRPYGVFLDTTTQTNPVANAENLVTYNTISEAHGITVDSGSPDSKIYVAQSGVYNFQFSAQLDKSGGGASAVYIWFKYNGASIADSATKVVIDGPNAEVAPAWNYMMSLRQNDYFQMAWSSPDTAVILSAAAAASPVPAIPSVIMTVSWVSPLIV